MHCFDDFSNVLDVAFSTLQQVDNKGVFAVGFMEDGVRSFCLLANERRYGLNLSATQVVCFG